MSLPGYDLWKTATPWDDFDDSEEDECPHCGARPGQGCGLIDEEDRDAPEPPCVTEGGYYPKRDRQRDPDEALQEKRDRAIDFPDIDEEIPF